MTQKVEISFQLNGEEVTVKDYPMSRALDVLRESLRVTSPKEGCGEGECGSCTILVDGELANSCLFPLIQLEGCQVETVDYLVQTDLGQRLESAFLKHNGAQCGICTPGMLVASYYLLKRNPEPTLEEVQKGLGGNFCRCTGYTKIFDAVMEAGKR